MLQVKLRLRLIKVVDILYSILSLCVGPRLQCFIYKDYSKDYGPTNPGINLFK